MTELRLAHDDTGGDCPALVLLHGFPHDRTLWAAQRDALAARWRVIVPDLRGFGTTPAIPPFTIDRFADDVAALLEGCGIARAVIGGLSMGGYVALALWRRHRDRVRALVLADTRAAADDEAARARRDALIALAERDGIDALIETQLTGSLGATTRSERPDVVERTRIMMRQAASIAGVVGALRAMRERPDATPVLATIGVPALCIVGDEDVITPEREMRAMANAIPGSELNVIPGAGHLSAVEQPVLVTTAMQRFLGSLAPPTT